MSGQTPPRQTPLERLDAMSIPVQDATRVETIYPVNTGRFANTTDDDVPDGFFRHETADGNILIPKETGYEIKYVDQEHVKSGLINFCNNFFGMIGSFNFGEGGGGAKPIGKGGGIGLWVLTLTLVSLQTAVVRSIVLPRLIELSNGTQKIQVLGYIVGKKWSDYWGKNYREAGQGRVWLKTIDRAGKSGKTLESRKLGHSHHPSLVPDFSESHGMIYVGACEVPLPEVGYETGPVVLEVSLSSSFGVQHHDVLLMPKSASQEQALFNERVAREFEEKLRKTPFVLGT